MSHESASEIPGADERRGEQERIRKEYPDFYYVVVRVGAVVVFAAIGFVFISDQLGYRTNLFTEGVSILTTVLILNFLAEAREKRRYKQDLIYRMGSQVNSEAIRAVEELRRHWWHFDGSLKGAILVNAVLENADLRGANLENAKLLNATLKGADLSGASLRQAFLLNVNLESADLSDADLEGVNLMKADLQGARLLNASLKAVDLSWANLLNASMFDAILEDTELEGATLPNGDTWYAGYDMTLFTDPYRWCEWLDRQRQERSVSKGESTD